MSEFVDEQAEESEHEDEDEYQPAKRPRIASDDDDEDEEEDERKIAEEMHGFVVSGSEDSGDEGEENKDEGKKSDSEEDEPELEEDDEELINENLGISVKKPQRRIHVSDSDEEDDKNYIEGQLFDESEDPNQQQKSSFPQKRTEDYQNEERESESGEESEGLNEFIEDDDDVAVPGQRRPTKKRAKMPISDSALQEAREIFGDAIDLYDLYPDEAGEEEIEEGEDEYEDDTEQPAELRRTKKVTKKKSVKKSLLEHLEPSELDRGYLSEQDKKIQLDDKPERFQLRGAPVTEGDDDELTKESHWIYRQAFVKQTLSFQDQEDSDKKKDGCVDRIKEALTFIRNQDFEVPFIAFYRKEYVDPDLSISDLWKIYQWDEKWCQLQTRKRNLAELFRRMQKFITDAIMENMEQPLNDDIRLLEEEDIEMIYSVETQEHLQDVYLFFVLYYGRFVPKMVEWEQFKEAQENGENADITPKLKQASRRDKYTICVDAGLCGLARLFGMTPRQYAENFENQYSKHLVEQHQFDPIDAAQKYISAQFDNVDDVLKAATYVVGMQFSREPLVRKAIRDVYHDKAVICVRPTKKGLKEIDENHPIYGKKYLKNKFVRELEKDEFLKLVQAESLGLIKITMTMDPVDRGRMSYYQDIINKSFYQSDEFNERAKQWDDLRNKAVGICLDLVYQYLEKETRSKLLQEAKEYVIRESCLTLYNWLKVGPYVVEGQTEENEGGDSTKCRIMGIAYSKDYDQASFAAIIDGDGEVTDHLRLVHLTKRVNSFKSEERRLKEQDLDTLRQFIATKRPTAIALAAESLEALTLAREIGAIVKELEDDGQLKLGIPVELVDTELAKVYMNSVKAQTDFADYPILLREAISLARRLQDPLVEFCQMCTPDEEILCLKYHPLQDLVNKEELLNSLVLEFVNRVNEVGVDVNRCLEHPHTSSMLQFVCGLGPRKATHLLKVLRQNDNLLENRTKLVTVCHMGPKVFMNCAGFIKIDTVKVAEKTDAYVEVLDGSRVHPETYEWARKMAVDALEYDDTTEDANPASALEEILESPERLKDLDLDAFAEELQRQGFGNKNITLYDIRAELNHCYKDLRITYKSPTPEELFHLLTRETPNTFNEGKLVVGRVMGVVYKKPKSEHLDGTNPTRNDETGNWICPLCLKNDFSELSEVWSHFDSKLCPGQAIGVRVKLENGVSGFIPTRNISDKRVENPADRVKVGMPIYCRITKVEAERFQVELSCRSSDLRDEEGKFKPKKDLYHDSVAEEEDLKTEKHAQNLKQKFQYIKRVIAHPYFQNCNFKDAERKLTRADQGEVVIRPSSKGQNHLTLTWKVAENVYQHVDIREEGKENAFSLGRTLYIGDEVFEDLDEIVARYVNPMAANVRELLNYKYFKENFGKDAVEIVLQEEKQKNPNKISYCFSLAKDMPGKFMLSYLPRLKARHEYVTVVPNGFRFRGIVHRSLMQLLAWFKEHFRDPIPGATPMGGTPIDQSSYHSHGITPRFDQMSRATPAQIGRTPGGWPAPQPNAYMPPPPMPFATPAPSMYHAPQVGATPNIMAPPVHYPSTNTYPAGSWSQQQQPMEMEHQFAMPQHQRDSMSPRRSGRAGSDWSDSARNWGNRRDPNESYYNNEQQEQYYGGNDNYYGGEGGGKFYGKGGGYNNRGRGGGGRGGGNYKSGGGGGGGQNYKSNRGRW